MTPEEARLIYNNKEQELSCFEYLKASAVFELDLCKERQSSAYSSLLAALLANEVVFLNTHWREDTWPKDARRTTALFVNCNDVFAWGCADAEDLLLADLPDLFGHWVKDQHCGAAIWCVKKRQQMPQRPVEKLIREGGIWDLDAILKEPPK